MALPIWKAKGTFTSGTGALSVPWPTSGTYAIGDLAFLAIHSANEAIATPSGWTQVGNSPQSIGTAATAGGVRLAVFWKYATSATEANVSVADSGSITAAQIHVAGGAHSSAPIHLTTGSTQAATTSMSFPGLTTTINDCLIFQFCAQDTDAASTATSGTPTNASLGSLTERHDQTVTAGAGGGLVILTGTKATAGTVSATTSTGSTSVTHAYITVAVAPTSDVSVALTGQTFAVTQGTPTRDTSIATVGSIFPVSISSDIQLTNDISFNLTGQSYSHSQGAVTPSQLNTRVYWAELVIPVAVAPTSDVSVALTGQTFAVTQGTPTKDTDIATVSLSGQAYSYSDGVITPSQLNIKAYWAELVIPEATAGDPMGAALSGVTAAFVLGSAYHTTSILVAPTVVTCDQGTPTRNVAYTLTGQILPVSTSNIAVSSTVFATSNTATVSQGSFANSLDKLLTGQIYTVSQGSLSYSEGFALAGNSYTALQTSISLARNVSLVGTSAPVTIGNVSYSGDSASSVTLTGYSVTLNSGNIAASFSKPISQITFSLSNGSLAFSKVFSLAGLTAGLTQGALSNVRSLGLSSNTLSVLQSSIAPANSNVTVSLNGHSLVLEQSVIGMSQLRQLTSQIISVASETLSSINGRYLVGSSTVFSIGTLSSNRLVSIDAVNFVLLLGEISSNIAASPIQISGEARQMLADIWARLQLNPATPVVDNNDTITIGGIVIDISESTNATVYTRVDTSHVTIGNEEQRILEIYKRLGLDRTVPLVEENNKATIGDIQILMVEANGSVTSQRQV